MLKSNVHMKVEGIKSQFLIYYILILCVLLNAKKTEDIKKYMH